MYITSSCFSIWNTIVAKQLSSVTTQMVEKQINSADSQHGSMCEAYHMRDQSIMIVYVFSKNTCKNDMIWAVWKA